jgi:general secretion pathway protein D
LIGDIPVVGNLFRYKRDRLQKTNLLIFITPHVLSDQEELDQITEKKKQELSPAMKDLEKNNGLPSEQMTEREEQELSPVMAELKRNNVLR